ncbi:MAG: cysteine hydrolase [Halieaceae bacterium]
MKIRSEKTALLVIDMQNGFCDEAGSVTAIGLPASRLRPAIGGCVSLIEAARATEVPIIFTRYVYRPDYLDGGLMAHELIPDLRDGKTLIAGTWDSDLLPEMAPMPQDFIVDKNRPSSFFGTNLDATLKNLGVEDLVVCGVTTNCCVETTVRDASQRDYRTFIVQDAVAEYEDDRHEIALRSMGMLFGHVVTLDDILAGWSSESSAA